MKISHTNVYAHIRGLFKVNIQPDFLPEIHKMYNVIIDNCLIPLYFSNIVKIKKLFELLALLLQVY